jgi:ribosomal protein L20
VRPITSLPRANASVARRLSVVAWIAGRNAVHAHVPLLNYLRNQLAQYRVTAPRDVTAPIPELEVSSTGELVLQYPSGEHHPTATIFTPAADLGAFRGPLAAEAGFQRRASDAATAAAARVTEYHDAEQRVIEQQLRAAEEEIAEVEAAKTASLASQADALAEAQPEITPAASVPPRWKIVLWRLFEIAAIAGETMTTFAALLNSGGIDASNLASEWANGASAAIIGWGIAALTIAALLFVTTEWAFARIADAIHAVADPARGFRLITGAAALLFVAAAVIALASLRAQLGTAGHGGIGAVCLYIVISVVPLLGGALVHLRANTLASARAEALQIARTPTATDLARRFRDAQEAELLAKRDRLLARREELLQRLHLLQAQMHAAEQALRDRAQREHEIVARWIDSVEAALGKDRKHFEHFARAWNRTHLLPAATPVAEVAAVVPMRKRRVAQ